MNRHRAIEEKAIEWLIRRDEPDWSGNDQEALSDWLQESMANRAAYLRAERGWAEADRVRSLGHWDKRGARFFRRHHPWWPIGVAASVLATIGIGTYSLAPHLSAQVSVRQGHFATALGERQSIALSDGSKVELNTRTKIRAFLNSDRRDVWLDAGEAYFEVKHSDSQPFHVYAGSRTITDLGTRFSVRRDGDRVTVNVVEGSVRVDDDQGRGKSAAIITAGDTAYAGGGSTMIAPRSVERVENALAWRDGMLSFNLIPLSQVAAEFNRYNRKQIDVAPSAASIPIGGTFQASNVDGFIRLLHDVYGLKTEQNGEDVNISI